MAAYRSLLWTLAALVALVVPLTGAPLAHAEPLPVENSLVQISTRADFQGVVGNGTGIILTPEGVVLTNHHVIQGADAIRALTLSNGQTYDADVLGYDRNNDVAVIQLRGAAGLIPAPIGDSSALRVGEPVTTMGNANGTGNPLTREQGAVTELGATISAEDELTGSSHSLDNLIESSTNLRSGDSGGARERRRRGRRAAHPIRAARRAGRGGRRAPGRHPAAHRRRADHLGQRADQRPGPALPGQQHRDRLA